MSDAATLAVTSAATGDDRVNAELQEVASGQNHDHVADGDNITFISQPAGYNHASPPPQPQQLATHVSHPFSSQLEVAGSPIGDRSSPYNMGPLASALPQGGYRPGHYNHGGQQRMNPAMMHQMSHMAQFAGPPSMSLTGQGYYHQQHQHQHQHQQHQQHASHYHSASQPPTIPQQSVGPPRQNMSYYPNHMMMNQHHNSYYYPPTTQYAGQPAPHMMGSAPRQFGVGSPTAVEYWPRNSNYDQVNTSPQYRNQQQDSPIEHRDAVRGPPRKPHQSGHAVWIGNLPPQTELMNLVFHVCKEVKELESLFLISKSNCAFANFKDDAGCVAAQQKLHDSKFQNVRLVCRLRKSAVEGPPGISIPTGPAAEAAVKSPPQIDGQVQDAPSSIADGDTSATDRPLATLRALGSSEGFAKKDRFFILKSLTIEDLELSVQTGIWATQSHNEDILNLAFKHTDNVYLVFSANKSGEYFGYARMTSEVNEDPAAAIQFAPKSQAASELELPKAIPIDATEHVPKGRIIDDSARGTIYWEVDKEESEGGSDSGSDAGSTNAEDETQTWGKPFKLHWLSTTRLPFYRTRGLRNSWNSNREVKIARDGTELEPATGRRLIGLFNRIQSPPAGHAGVRMPMGGMAHGYSHPRQYGR
ncbi:YT521-B-like domain-containing protein [Stachybotrys elegans]|uniref:YT521-B-like domain-containing protein n=1 Tax=Stachybotrys elegans TaxID=80388 RepID=A0A8K0WWK9_9HYPO|nr:YT521-B-like domain-containing protein [Stachybotrys elegans]